LPAESLRSANGSWTTAVLVAFWSGSCAHCVRYDGFFNRFEASGRVAAEWFAPQTPRVYLVDRDRRLRYRGAIDNYKYRDDPAYRPYLDSAIDEFLAGARVRLIAAERTQHRLVSGGSGFGCLPFEQHFGIGAATSIQAVDIDWPSGLRQRIADPPVNATIRVTEGIDQIR
jgi:ASPIC and UnbV